MAVDGDTMRELLNIKLDAMREGVRRYIRPRATFGQQKLQPEEQLARFLELDALTLGKLRQTWGVGRFNKYLGDMEMAAADAPPEVLAQVLTMKTRFGSNA